MTPDYSLYPDYTKDTAYGFLTRGCPNNCGFCMVCEKEGRESHKVADLSEWWNGQKNIFYAKKCKEGTPTSGFYLSRMGAYD